MEHGQFRLAPPPTFLDIAGVPVPYQYGGRSLTDVGGPDRCDDIVAEFHGHKYTYE